MKTVLSGKVAKLFSLCLILGFAWSVSPELTVRAASATITVAASQWGTSTCYIGATEGNVRFNIADLQDAGINTYRIYGGMQRWEQQDDDGVFGSPSIAEIKANVNVINWAWWDTA